MPTTTTTLNPTLSYAETITNRLNLYQPLLDILTGGVFYWPNLGRKGLTRTKTPSAFMQELGLVKPTAVVLNGDEKPTYEAVDPATGYMSTETSIFIWVYDNGDTGYGNVRPAAQLIYNQVHAKQIAGGFQALYKDILLDKREPDLKDSAYYRLEYCVYGFRSYT